MSEEVEGRYRDADALYQKAFDQAEQQKLPDVAAGILLAKAQGKALAGMCNDVPALVKQALSLDKSKATLRAAGLPAALCGEAKLAMPLLEDLQKKFPQDTVTNTLSCPRPAPPTTWPTTVPIRPCAISRQWAATT